MPSLILLDLSMPVMNGMEFRAEQRRDAVLWRIPTVISSAGKLADRVPTLDAVAFLRKPVSFDQLLTLVARYCTRKAVPAEP
jgi:CheY-like chemotaxis protein